MRTALLGAIAALALTGCTDTGEFDWKLVTKAAIAGTISAYSAEEDERQAGIIGAVGVIQEGLE